MKTKQSIVHFAILLGIISFISSCKFGPNFEKPQPKTSDYFRFDSAQIDSVVNISWWEMFNDPILDTLIQTALDSNKDVQIAAAKIEEYRSIVGYKKGATWPAFGYQGNARYGNYNGFITQDNFGSAVGGVGMNWEIDFWGKFRRATESAKADLLANEYNRRAIQISLISDVSSSYFTILDYKWRLEIAKKTIEIRKENVNIIQQKFDYGLVPEIDLSNAKVQYAIALAAQPRFERLLAFEENRLSVLLGMNPHEILTGTPLKEQVFAPEIPPGIPSTLLLRRPDIGFSEAKFHAQMAQIGVAQAMRFPSISLTGILGAGTSQLTDITTGLAWNAGSSLIGPIFQWGLNKRRVEIEVARTEQTKLEYERTVIQAFKEVEDALIAVSTYKKELEANQLQAKSAMFAQDLSQLRYDKGVTSYLEVITLQGFAFDAELQLSGTMRTLFNSYIQLYKALGGGWISEKERQDASQTNQAPNDLPKVETEKEKNQNQPQGQ